MHVDNEARHAATAPDLPPVTAPVDTSPAAVGVRWYWLVPAATALILVAVGVLALLPLRTPPPADVGAADTTFAAQRAHPHIAEIARSPHPTGSTASAEVRRYLTQVLTGLGLTPTTTSHSACRPTAREAECGQVSNVSAAVRGRRGEGTVVLVAHYDSVMGGTGASDDGLGVATGLEIARAVTAGPAMDNDLLLLFTDGEEQGLLGAQAAIDGGMVPDPARSVVLNLVARGPSGPVIMFQTGDQNGAVVDALNDHSVVATSFADAVYRLLPNDTDFTVFREAGFNGMNFAVIGGSARYNNPTDNLESVDLSSVQDMGVTVLSAVRRLGDTDLGSVAHSGQVTYFPVFGWVVSYPQQLATVVSVLAAFAVAAAMWFTRRRRVTRLSTVGFTAGALLAAAMVGVASGIAGWRLILLARPDYVGFILGDPYRPEPGYLGFALVAVAIVAAWWGLVVRRATALEVNAAVTGVLALCAVACLFVAPGAAYLAAWPALAGAVALAAAGWLPAGSRWRPLVWALPGGAAVLVLAPVTAVLFPAVGLASVAAPMMFVALLAGAVLAALALPRPGWRTATAVSAVLLAAGGTLVAVGTSLDDVDGQHPRPISLVYAIDASTGTANWLSPFPVPDPFIDHYVGGQGQPWTEQFPFLQAPRYRSGSARVVATPAPTVSLLQSIALDNGRRLRLRLAADSPAATAIALYVDTETTTVVEGRVAGQRVPGGNNRPDADAWRWGFIFVGPLSEGMEAELTVTGTGPVRLRTIVQTPGLPAEAMDVPTPDTVTSAIAPMQTVTARTSTF